MAKIYVVYNENQSLNTRPGYVTNYGQYWNYGVGVIEDNVNDQRVDISTYNAEVLGVNTARAVIFSEAHNGTVSLRSGTTALDEFPQITASGEPAENKFTYTLSADDLANGLAFAKYILKRIVRDRYNQKFLEIEKPYATYESTTWEIQKSEADAWTADNTVSTPFLTAYATARSTTVSNLVSKINSKRSDYNTAVAAVLGAQKLLEDEIDALTTITQTLEWRHNKGIANAPFSNENLVEFPDKIQF